jgi:hypothetical protein
MTCLKEASYLLEKNFGISHNTISVEDPNDIDYEEDCQDTNIH